MRSIRDGDARSERSAALLGLALGTMFTVCFVTGVLSHLVQDPPSWFVWPPRPAGWYRLNQGLHVTTGLAAIPLLVAKIWVVHPKLFESPMMASVTHGVQRVALLPLVGGSAFLLVSGLGNVHIWRPWPFSFRDGHYAAAWIAIGGLVIHVAAQWSTSRAHLRRSRRLPGTSAAAAAAAAEVGPRGSGMSRRALLYSVSAATGLVALLTVGQTVRPLRALAVLAPRRPDSGPQGFPVNRTAASVGLTDVDLETYRLVVDGPGVTRALSLSYADLRAMTMHEAELPIACVEGWSVSRRWRGIRVRDLVAEAGGEAGRPLEVVSLQESTRLQSSEVNGEQAADADLLLALEVEGEALHPDHGFPARLIGPNRPGVQQTKWVGRIVVS